MIKSLLKNAINTNNSFLSKDIIKLQIIFFNSTIPPKLTDEEKDELLSLMGDSTEETD